MAEIERVWPVPFSRDEFTDDDRDDEFEVSGRAAIRDWLPERLFGWLEVGFDCVNDEAGAWCRGMDVCWEAELDHWANNDDCISGGTCKADKS